MDKYQEALERAKKGLPIDEVFPELKESEDERIRKEMIHWLKEFIGEEEGCGYTEDEIRERIAYLEKQKEQKPAEWSEEDEKMCQHVISDLREFRDCEIDEELISDYEDEISWLKNRLKSLRPSFRPSDEQISALEYFIRSWGESGTMSPQNTILCAAKSLLNDLKKL